MKRIYILANAFARVNLFFKNSCLRMAVFYFVKEGEAMKLADHLSKEQKQQLRKMQQSTTKRKSKVKKQEHLSRRDWEDLMGIHMDTYERRNGAVRRK